MKRKVLILLILITLLSIVTGCNKSPINLYDYTHKPAVEFQTMDEQRGNIDSILDKFKEKGGF